MHATPNQQSPAAANVEQARFNMVEQQIRPWEVLDPTILALLMSVRREDFVPAAYRGLAFADTQIPLSPSARMLPPKIEAKLLQELGLKKSDRVLEIGTGSGFMAALLAYAAGEVVSLEIDKALADKARSNLQAAGVTNASVEVADGAKGFPGRAPFDAIVISGAVPAVPDVLVQQLKVGGRLVAIVGKAPLMEAVLIVKTAETTAAKTVLFETEADPLQNFATPSTFEF
jgi:protein-L-isoaspartate(D-aspartate) O-methyltransferase